MLCVGQISSSSGWKIALRASPVTRKVAFLISAIPVHSTPFSLAFFIQEQPVDQTCDDSRCVFFLGFFLGIFKQVLFSSPLSVK